MAIPQLSPEERQAALEKAKAARIKRAEVRDDLKSGKLTLEKVLDMKEDRRPHEGFHPHRDPPRLRQGQGREDHEGTPDR